MATTDEKLDAILLMQAEILGRLQTLDAARDTPPSEDPRATAIDDLAASLACGEEKVAPLKAHIAGLIEAMANHGRSSS